MWNKKACLVLFLLAGCFIPLVAAPKEKPKAELDSVAYHGTFISTNLVSAAQMALGQNGGLNLQADVNLYNRFNPCIELGYAPFSLTHESGTSSHGQGFYGKLGLNMPISKYGPHAESQYFGGVRYAYSRFAYRLEDAQFSESYWGEAYSHSYFNEKAGAHWFEIHVGMRTKVLGPITLGWTLTMKKRLAIENAVHSAPAFIPGYGENRETNYGFLFNLYYLLPF